MRYLIFLLVLFSCIRRVHADKYIIVDMEIGEPILIGEIYASIGSEISNEDTIYWPKIGKTWIVAVKKNSLKDFMKGKAIVKREYFSNKQDNGVRNKGILKSFSLGARGNFNEVEDNIYVLHKKQDFIIPVKSEAQNNMFPEITFRDCDIVLPIKRVHLDYGDYYVSSSEALLQNVSTSSFVISIRERSVSNKKFVDYVYQNLIVVHFP